MESSYKLDFDVKKAIKKRALNPGERVQKIIDSEVLRRIDAYTPMDRNTLIKSGVLHTELGSGHVIQKTPYARRLYYSKQYNFQGAPKRGAFWFERMKADHKADILKLAAEKAGAK